jgi:hypothetical protein
MDVVDFPWSTIRQRGSTPGPCFRQLGTCRLGHLFTGLLPSTLTAGSHADLVNHHVGSFLHVWVGSRESWGMLPATSRSSGNKSHGVSVTRASLIGRMLENKQQSGAVAKGMHTKDLGTRSTLSIDIEQRFRDERSRVLE